jgi:hypothetical protein
LLKKFVRKWANKNHYLAKITVAIGAVIFLWVMERFGTTVIKELNDPEPHL